jgi:hypothetical protein
MNIVARSCFGPPSIVTSLDVKKQIDQRIRQEESRH